MDDSVHVLAILGLTGPVDCNAFATTVLRLVNVARWWIYNMFEGVVVYSGTGWVRPCLGVNGIGAPP